MHIDDLPRLTDEDREALNGGYIAMEGVPAHERKRRIFPGVLKVITAIAAAFALSACAMTPAQKWAGVEAGGLYVESGLAYQDIGERRPEWQYQTIQLGSGVETIGRQVTRDDPINPYGRLSLGYEIQLSPQFRAAVEVIHCSSVKTSEDRGVNSAALSLRWYPFRR